MIGDVSPTNRGTLVGVGPDKTGRQIDVFWDLDVDRPDSVFTAHQATAWHDDVLLGYMRVDYVEADRYARILPTIWNHFCTFGGATGLRPGVDPRTFEGEKAARFRINMLHHLRRYNSEDPGSYAAFEMIAKKTCAYQELLAKKQRFFSFHVDKPYVGYVDTGPHGSPYLAQDSSGLGIGKLLYCGAAVALHTMGYTLRASDTQSDHGRGIWTTFIREGWTTQDDDAKARHVLHGDLIPHSVFIPASAAPDDTLSP